VFDLVGQDAAEVRRLWKALGEQGYFDLSSHLPEFEAKYGFVSGASSHADRLATIRRVQEDTGVLIDPHTADGVKVAEAYLEDGIPMLALETALPAKFGETILEATGKPAPVPAHLAGLDSLPQRVDVLPNDAAQVRQYVQERAQV